jgi:hypothetical protein
MAYDEFLADRIRRIFKDNHHPVSERNMMGGRIFFLDDKMLCGIHIDKKYGDSLLMLRIGEEAYKTAIDHEHTLPMDFTGRPMRGYIFVTPDGFDMDDDLEYWLELGVAYNPLAKASKKRKPKT